MTIVSITYCRPCGYEKRARLAAEALKKELDVTAEIIPGGGGIFEVRLDGEVVARRSREHFPDAAEIVSVIAQKLLQSA